MFKRNISLEEVKFILDKGDVIREYQDDKPYPSFLLLAFKDLRPLHLLVAKDIETGICIIVTVYEPNPIKWLNQFSRRIK